MISTSADYTLLAVHPSDHETLTKEVRHDFADYDLCAPPVFVTTALFFPLAAHADKEKITSALQKGLASTLKQIPVFAGILHHDAGTNRPYALQKQHDTVAFGVRHLDGASSSFPSLEQWEAAGYPDGEITNRAEQLFPPGIEPSDQPMGIRIDSGCVMSAFQLNFITGGIILISAFHHYQGDATTCDMFCNTWAENSKAFTENDSHLSTFKASFDRNYFTMPTSEVDQDRVKSLLKTVRAVKLVNLPPAPVTIESDVAGGTEVNLSAPAAAPLQIGSRTVHVSANNCTRLKKLCAPSESGKYVSTYDCIVALIWRAMTRARQPMHPEWHGLSQDTRLMSAVNVRDRFDVTSKQYIGNGVAASQTDPISMDTLVSEPMGVAALLCRNSILNINPSTIPEVLELAKSALGKQQMGLDGAFHLGPDVLATSWSKMNVYNYDFGFGLTAGFRAIPAPLDGCVAIYPRCARRGDAEGFEMCVKLEEKCLARLCQDKELLQYSEIRGDGRFE